MHNEKTLDDKSVSAVVTFLNSLVQGKWVNEKNDMSS